MKVMKILSGPLSMFGAKVEIAAREKAINFELVMVPFDPTRGYEPKHTDVLRINPKRQVPVLIDGDLELFDSTQIFEYLEDLKPHPALWPAEPAARARARQLELLSDEVSITTQSVCNSSRRRSDTSKYLQCSVARQMPVCIVD
jgi:glutathione S-transferase